MFGFVTFVSNSLTEMEEAGQQCCSDSFRYMITKLWLKEALTCSQHVKVLSQSTQMFFFLSMPSFSFSFQHQEHTLNT
jgi:hypothetical protein